MLNTNKAILAGTVVALGAGAGIWVLGHRNADGDVIYRTATVEKRDLRQTVSATGIVQPFTVVDIKSRAGGEIKVLAVDVGTRVKAGDLIARIDPTDSQTTFTQAESDVVAARARVSSAQQTRDLQAATSVTGITESRAAVQAAQARLGQARAQANAQPALTESAIRQSRAALFTAEQNLAVLKGGTDPQARADARNTLASAEANLKNADLQLQRQQNLAAKGFVAQSTVDAAQAARDVAYAQAQTARTRAETVGTGQEATLSAAQSRVNEAREAVRAAEANRVQIALRRQDVASAEAALAQARASLATTQANQAQVGIRAADIETARAQISRSQASLSNAKIVLDLTTIRAPQAGVVLQKYVEQGTIITSGQSFNSVGTSLVQLGDLSRVLVDAAVDESDIARVTVGQKVKVTLDAFPDKDFEGRVRLIDPRGTTDQNITSVRARIEIINPDPLLRPGLNSECEFLVQEKKDVLVVPLRAIKGDKGQKTVQVMGPDKKPVSRNVTTGLEAGDSVEITSGLKEGESIVTGVTRPGDDKKGGGKGGDKGGPGGGGGSKGGGGGR